MPFIAKHEQFEFIICGHELIPYHVPGNWPEFCAAESWFGGQHDGENNFFDGDSGRLAAIWRGRVLFLLFHHSPFTGANDEKVELLDSLPRVAAASQPDPGLSSSALPGLEIWSG